MSHFYQYDTRGASTASQMIWLEDELNRLRDQNERLRNAATFAFAVLLKNQDEQSQIAAETLRSALWPNICGND